MSTIERMMTFVLFGVSVFLIGLMLVWNTVDLVDNPIVLFLLATGSLLVTILITFCLTTNP